MRTSDAEISFSSMSCKKYGTFYDYVLLTKNKIYILLEFDQVMNKGFSLVVFFASILVLSSVFVSAGWFCDRMGLFCEAQLGPGPQGNNSTGNMTHLECRNMQCVAIPGAGKNRCVNSKSCYNTVCLNNTCAQVPGNGTITCWPIGGSCGINNQTHLECRNYACTRVSGSGSNLCSPEGSPCNMTLPECSDGIDNDGDLLIDYPADPGCSSPSDNSEYNAPTNQTHLECLNNMCSVVNGSGTNQCSIPGAYCNSTNMTRPDLIIASHTVYTYNMTGNYSVVNVTIVTRVSNIGNAIAAPSTTRIQVFGMSNYTANVATNALAPGASQDLVRGYILSHGSWWVYSKADYGLVVSESNENNNERTTPFVV